MNATRAAALPAHRTENLALPRPRLHVVYRAEGSLAVVAPPAAALPAAVPPVKPAQPTTSPLRLTRRGRVAVAGLAVLFVAVLSLFVAGAAQATSHAMPLSAAQHNLAQVAVRPGQTLWSVAESADPDADTRLVIQQILKLNALHGDTVVAGERLWVPRG